MKKKVLTAILAASMVLSLAGCGKGSSTESAAGSEQQAAAEEQSGEDSGDDQSAGDASGDSAAEQTTPYVDEEGFTHAIILDSPGEVNVFAFSEGQNYQKVLDRFHEVTAGSLKTTLNFQFATSIKEEQPLKLAGKEDIDLIFDASWVNSAKNLADGMYADLTSYFNNPDYPGIQAAFPENVLDALRYTDGKIYGIPYSGIDGPACIYIRGDWREQLGLPEVVDKDTLYQYLEGVSEHADELGILAPMGMGNRGWFMFDVQETEKANAHIYEVTGTGARATQNMYVLLNEDDTQVLDATMVGDMNHDFSQWPGGVSPLNDMTIEYGNRWSKFVNSDAISNEQYREQFQQGLYAATESDLGAYIEMNEKLKSANPDAKLEFYVYDNCKRNMETMSYATSYSNNFMYVPYYCEDIERTMAVVDWVFESQANNDLFTLGIEGDDWEAVGDKQYRTIEGNDDPYTFPTWLWSQNPTLTRLSADLPDDVLAYYEYSADPANHRAHPFAGYSYMATNVELENTALTTLQEDYYHQFMIGSFGEETEAKLNEFGSQAADYIEAVRAEVIAQVQSYIDNRQ